MGSHRETIEVRPSEVAPAPPSAPVYNYGFRTISAADSLPSRIVDAALSVREMGDYDRNASPDVDGIQLVNITPEELSGIVIDKADKNNRTTVVAPIMDTRDYEIRKKTIRVSLNHSEWDDYRLGGGVVWDKVREALPEVASNISCYRVLTENGVAKKSMDGWKVSSTIDVDTSGGKAKTIYQLRVNGTVDPMQEFKTIAEARAGGVKVLEENLKASYVDVVAKVVRENGTPMVKMKRKVRSATAKVEVEYVHVTSKKPRLTHYFVSMWFHS